MASLQFTEGTASPTPVFGPKQLLPNLIDGLANIRPESTYAKIPRSISSWDEGSRKITYRLFARAIDALASWLLRTLGPPKRPFQSLAYFGAYDPRYPIFTVAVIKAGYKAALPSGGRDMVSANSAGAKSLLHFLNQIECDTVLAASVEAPAVKALSSLPSFRIFEVPSLNELLEYEGPRVPYTKTFDEAKDDPFLALHTSGSTGQPKPLIYTKDWAATWMRQAQEPPPQGFQSMEYRYFGADLFAFSPPAHSGGFFAHLLAAVANEMPIIYPLPGSLLTLEAIFETLKHLPADILIAPPYVLDQVSLDPAHIDFLKAHTRMLAFGGGPLSQRTGDILSQHFTMWSVYGSGELGTISKILPAGKWRPEYWNSVVPNVMAGFEFRPISGLQNNYEAVVVRNPNPEHGQTVFKMKPELNEWSTKDVFVGHPAPEHGEGFRFYSYSHRIEDSLRLAPETGSEFGRLLVPLKFEQQLSGTELIRSAVVFGDGQPQPGVLIELAQEARSHDATAFDGVAQQVKATTGLLGANISTKHILLVDPGKPLPRAPKGTIQRAAALRLYAEDIESVYRAHT